MVSLQKKFLLVVIDYFFKWVKAEPLARITEGAMIQFLWKNIICQYGIPRKLISDNGPQFQGYRIKEWCQNLWIEQAFTSITHPQANGQGEVTNRILVQGLITKLEAVQRNWVEELLRVLWAYHTIIRSSIGETPFCMVYETEVIITVEILVESARVQVYDPSIMTSWEEPN